MREPRSKATQEDWIYFLRPHAFAPYVGFTEAETEALAARHYMGMAELRRWFDG